MPDSLNDDVHLIFYFDLDRTDHQLSRLMKWEGSKWMSRHDYEEVCPQRTIKMTTLYVDFHDDAEAAALWWAWLIQACYKVPMMPYTYNTSVKGKREKLMKQSVKQAHGFMWRARSLHGENCSQRPLALDNKISIDIIIMKQNQDIINSIFTIDQALLNDDRLCEEGAYVGVEIAGKKIRAVNALFASGEKTVIDESLFSILSSNLNIIYTLKKYGEPAEVNELLSIGRQLLENYQIVDY